MNCDNQWHPGIIADHADGSFGIYDDFEDAFKNSAVKLTDPPVFKAITYNYNRGQPLVNFGDFVMSIVDIEKRPAK